MTPRQKALGVVAVVLIVLAVAGIVATAVGWEPVGPADLPVKAYAPTPGDGATFRTLDHGSFEVHGATYEAELMGFSNTTDGSVHGYEVRIVRTGGDGGRVWPSEAVARTGNETLASFVFGVPGQVPREPDVEDGVLVARLDMTPPAGEGNATVDVTLRTYREIGVGVWREEPLGLRFTYAYSGSR